jgi:predicted Zn-dependent protease with MMP-like domain
MKLSRDEFQELVHEALEQVPESFRSHLENLSVDVEDMPDRVTCESVGLDDPRRLLGFYHGTPLTKRSVEQPFRYPERVVLYQINIQRICRTRRQIVEQVRKTVLHEIGHHFGLDEDDLDELGYR